MNVFQSHARPTPSRAILFPRDVFTVCNRERDSIKYYPPIALASLPPRPPFLFPHDFVRPNNLLCALYFDMSRAAHWIPNAGIDSFQTKRNSIFARPLEKRYIERERERDRDNRVSFMTRFMTRSHRETPWRRVQNVPQRVVGLFFFSW